MFSLVSDTEMYIVNEFICNQIKIFVSHSPSFNVWTFGGGGRLRLKRLSYLNFEFSYNGLRSHENHKTEIKITVFRKIHEFLASISQSRGYIYTRV